jgi:hypothetical protein
LSHRANEAEYDPRRAAEKAQAQHQATGETAMAKGQVRANKEKKKPKQEKEKKPSAYAQAYGSQQQSSPLGMKKEQH